MSNPGTAYDIKMISKKTQVKTDMVRRVVNMLKSVGLIKPKVFYKEVKKKKGKEVVTKKQKTNGFMLDKTFPYLSGLHKLLIQGRRNERLEVLDRIKPAGAPKLVIISGVFLQIPDSRVDLLIVGDKIKKGALDRVVRKIESEIGKELRYAVFSTDEFQYRMNVYDKLVRDVLEFPHEKVLNKIGI